MAMHSSKTYILLFLRNKPGNNSLSSYHWAIGVTQDDNLSKGFHIFQVEDLSGPWKHSFPSDCPISVNYLERFHLAIYIGTIQAAIDDIRGFAEESPPDQCGTPLLSTHGKWSCALWIIRLLHSMQEAGIFEDIDLSTQRDQETFYRRILAIGSLASSTPNAAYRIITEENNKVVVYY